MQATVLILGPVPRRDAAVACAVRRVQGHVAVDADLAGQAGLAEQAVFLQCRALLGVHLGWLSAEKVDLASGAAGEAATAVQDIVPGILDREDELFSGFDFKGFPALDGNCRHESVFPFRGGE